MFSKPLTVYKGIDLAVPWLAPFQISLQVLTSQHPPDASGALETSLREWEQISVALAADDRYDPRERYCIQQSCLWKIYAATEQHDLAEAVGRMVYNRACRVLEQTPAMGRPADLSFREGEQLIQKMLAHLRSVALFYQHAVQDIPKVGEPVTIPPDAGFHRTNVLEATANPAEAKAFLQLFLADNQYVRTILLGDDVAAGAKTVDNRLNKPGGGIIPGRGLWVKSYSLLRPEISAWLAADLPHDYEQRRCIFISPQGKPASFLSKSEPLDQLNVSDAILHAADADEPS